jgi:PKD repeat protein
LVVIFTDLSEFAQQWNWTFGDGNTSSLQNPENTYSKGTYTVTLEVTNPAGTNSITKENLIVVDPDNIPQEWNNRIQVFPNPATSKVTVQITNEKLELVTIELFDLIGKKLVSQTPVASKKMEELINVNQLEKGNYLLKVTIGMQLLVLKVAVE